MNMSSSNKSLVPPQHVKTIVEQYERLRVHNKNDRHQPHMTPSQWCIQRLMVGHVANTVAKIEGQKPVTQLPQEKLDKHGEDFCEVETLMAPIRDSEDDYMYGCKPTSTKTLCEGAYDDYDLGASDSIASYSCENLSTGSTVFSYLRRSLSCDW